MIQHSVLMARNGKRFHLWSFLFGVFPFWFFLVDLLILTAFSPNLLAKDGDLSVADLPPAKKTELRDSPSGAPGEIPKSALRSFLELSDEFSSTVSAGSCEASGSSSTAAGLKKSESAELVEPAYCDFDTFADSEFTSEKYEEYFPKKMLDDQKKSFKVGNNLHAFQLGPVTLVGVSIGKTNPRFAEGIAERLAAHNQYIANKKYKYCTWYFSSADLDEMPPEMYTVVKEQSEKEFNHFPLEMSPAKVGKKENTYDGLKSQFSKILNDVVLGSDPNFIDCILDQNFLAMGCNGMHHRGPLLFGAFLAFSGCTHESASAIVDHFWPPKKEEESKIRDRLFQYAQSMGEEHKMFRKKIQEKLLTQPVLPIKVFPLKDLPVKGESSPAEIPLLR